MSALYAYHYADPEDVHYIVADNILHALKDLSVYTSILPASICYFGECSIADDEKEDDIEDEDCGLG